MSWPWRASGAPSGNSGRARRCVAVSPPCRVTPRPRSSSSPTGPTSTPGQSTGSWPTGAGTAATPSPRPTAAPPPPPFSPPARSGPTPPTRARSRSRPASLPATTSCRRETSTSLLERDPESRQLLPELRRHLFGYRLAHVDPQTLLELVAPLAIDALGQMCLRLILLLVGEDVVEIRLHHLLAVRAGVHHVASSRADSASSRFRMRRPRCSLDMTVPTGMSRIWAASA